MLPAKKDAIETYLLGDLSQINISFGGKWFHKNCLSSLIRTIKRFLQSKETYFYSNKKIWQLTTKENIEFDGFAFNCSSK